MKIKYILFIFCLLLPAQALATVYYVDSIPGQNCYGNYSIVNRNCSGSDGTSYTTIGEAENVARAGDTVYIRAGTYTENVVCGYSGTSGNYITFAAYPGEDALTSWGTPRGSGNAIIDGNFTVSNRSYIRIIGLEIKLSGGGNTSSIHCSNTNYVEILDNYIHHSGEQTYTIRSVSSASTYMTIRGNYLYYSGCGEDGTNCSGNSSGIGVEESNHILIEYNKLQRMGDNINNYRTGYSVYRNNYMFDFEPDYWTVSRLHPDIFQISGGTATGLEYLVIESNFAGSIETTIPVGNQNGHFFMFQEIGTDVASDVITRGNIIYKISSGPIYVGSLDYAYYYNNTFYDMLSRSDSSGSMSYWSSISDDPALNGIFRNSIVHTTDSTPGGTHAIVAACDNCSVTVNNQLCYNVQSTTGGDCDSTGDPLFTDIDNLDFSVGALSPAIDLGMYLTQARGDGSNTTALIVDDSRFFTDGMGIAEADKIIIGSGEAVRISSINSATSITLAEAQTWSNNDNIVLAQMLDASTPDVGALPYRAGGYSLSATYVLSGGTVTVTPNDANLVRQVIVYEDNIPVGSPDYDSPFTVSGVGSGSTIRVNVYSLYASTTPVIVATEASGSSTIKNPTGLKVKPPVIP